jgi:DNA-3-methyladenine glycosylase I
MDWKAGDAAIVIRHLRRPNNIAPEKVDEVVSSSRPADRGDSESSDGTLTVMPLRSARARCAWSGNNPLMIEYHDKEWGVPVHDDRTLFEFLILEGAQAGLSWQTVLNKRENYRKAFGKFDTKKIAHYTAEDAARLMADPGIIRNRLKVDAAIRNAQAFLRVQKEFGSFDAYIWQFVGGKTIDHELASTEGIQARTKESDSMSKDLLKRGFKFVGSTTCYAFMQAVGMVNDHPVTCFRHKEVLRLESVEHRRRGR